MEISDVVGQAADDGLAGIVRSSNLNIVTLSAFPCLAPPSGSMIRSHC